MSDITFSTLTLPRSAGHIVLDTLAPATSAWALKRLADAAQAQSRSLLAVFDTLQSAERIAEDLRVLGHECRVLTPSGRSPYDPVATDHSAVADQAAFRFQWLKNAEPQIVLTVPDVLTERWMPTDAFLDAMKTYRVGQSYGRDAITQHLVSCGYNPAKTADEPGTFVIRGSLIDVRIPGSRWALRFDLFGDELEKIRHFDPTDGQSGPDADTADIYPIRPSLYTNRTIARASQALTELGNDETYALPTQRLHMFIEALQQKEVFYELESFWPLFFDEPEPLIDSLLGQDTVVYLGTGVNIIQRVDAVLNRHTELREASIERHELAIPLHHHYLDAIGITQRLEQQTVLQDSPIREPGQQTADIPLRLGGWEELERELNLRRKNPERGPLLQPVIEKIKQWMHEGYRIGISTHGQRRAKKLQEMLQARRFDLPVHDALWGYKSPAWITTAALSRGFIDHHEKAGFVTEYEIFERSPHKPQKKQTAKADLSRLRSLKEGDPVIHVEHGVGIYKGLKRLVVEGSDGDFILIEYAGNDKLYLPVYQIRLLQPYMGPPNPKVDSLGGTRWTRTKQKVKDSVQAIAHHLLKLQAERKARQGFALQTPDDQYRAMEAAFPFTETPDQAKAIRDVTSDLSKSTPMDRLLCGDVGFGKTEVAMRAAFLSVLSGKQVGVLVPTTVLAEQHAQSFSARLKDFGVQVAVINRFRTKKEVSQIVEKCAAGQIDVLIGTHRLLSADVRFKDLGLLVIDEEQRFGVRHKERIKALKTHVHVLTMSATPIPRTLNMAVMGLRDLSLILTPPTERMAIQTEVVRYNEEVVANAIRQEIARGGQIFFVHNRVQSIEGVAEQLKELVPEARIVVAHGQMTGPQLEKIMTEFVRREHHVLLSTAIIESGIDIPSANTMIVDRADTFGLSQLHQLRGRIGRGRRKAYAYFLIPRNERVTKEATDRLAALKRHSDLGAGFHIASQDLDIRGAGDLLGEDQSGNIAAVGFELYSELLREAVEAAKGNEGRSAIEPEIKLSVAAVIPEEYLPDPLRRVSLYQQMSEASDDEALEALVEEVERDYGDAPPEVSTLMAFMRVRRILQRLGVLTLSGAIREGELKLGLAFHEHGRADRLALAGLLQRQSDRYKLSASGRLILSLKADEEWDDVRLLDVIYKAVESLPLETK